MRTEYSEIHSVDEGKIRLADAFCHRMFGIARDRADFALDEVVEKVTRQMAENAARIEVQSPSACCRSRKRVCKAPVTTVSRRNSPARQ